MNPRPTAVVVCYDTLAYWVCAFLEGAGVSIPEQMSVVGFDWLARWDPTVADILTSAAQDFEGFGIHATDLLLDRLAASGSSEPRHILLAAPLVIRSSTSTVTYTPEDIPAMSLGNAALR